jgi:hypothetical protein
MATKATTSADKAALSGQTIQNCEPVMGSPLLDFRAWHQYRPASCGSPDKLWRLKHYCANPAKKNGTAVRQYHPPLRQKVTKPREEYSMQLSAGASGYSFKE